MSTDPSSQIVISDPTTSVAATVIADHHPVVSVNDPTVAAAAIHSSNSTDPSGAEALVGHHHLQQEQQQHDVSASVQEDITITDPDHQNHGIHVVYNQYTTSAGTAIEATTTSEVVVNNEMPTIHTPDPTMMHNSGNTVNNMEGVSFNTMGATDQQVQHTGVELTKREEDSDQQYGTPQQMQVQMHHQQQQHHQVSMVQDQNTNNNPAPTSNIQVQDVASPTTTTQVVGTPGQVQVQTQQMTPGSIIGGGLSVQIPNATVSTTAQILSDNFRRRTRRSEGSPRIRKAAMLMIENPSLDRYSALVSSGYTKEEASSKKRLNNVSQRKRRLAQYLSDSAANGGGNNGVRNSKGVTNITNNGTAQDQSMMMGGMQGVQMNAHHHMNHDSMPQSVVAGNNTVPPMPPLSMGAGQSSSYQQTAAIPPTTPMQRDILISIVRDDERKGFVLLNKMSSAQDNGQLHYYHGEITLWDMLKRAPKDTGIFQIDTDEYDFPVLVVRRMKPTNASNTATTTTTENGVENTDQHNQQQQSSMDTEEYDDTFEFEFRKKEMQEFTVFKLMETFGFENTFSVQLKMTKQPHLEDKKNISLDD